MNALQHNNCFHGFVEEFSGAMQSNSIGPRRILVPQREVSKKSASNVGPLEDSRKSREVVSASVGHTVRDSIMQIKRTTNVAKETQEDASITPPSISGTITKAFDENLNPFDGQRDQIKPMTGCKDNNPMSVSHAEPGYNDGQKKVQFSIASKTISQGNICLILWNWLNESFSYVL